MDFFLHLSLTPLLLLLSTGTTHRDSVLVSLLLDSLLLLLHHLALQLGTDFGDLDLIGPLRPLLGLASLPVMIVIIFSSSLS